MALDFLIVKLKTLTSKNFPHAPLNPGYRGVKKASTHIAGFADQTQLRLVLRMISEG
jgi:hypothetical protein